MKNIILILTVCLCLKINGQIKTFTGLITDLRSESASYELTAQKEVDSPEIMVFILGNLPTECYRYFIKRDELKSEFKGKKFNITYTTVKDKNYIDRISLVGDKGPILEKDYFSSATCKAYDLNGKLIAIMENNTIYPIKDGKKIEDKSKGIQNKEEICVKPNECIKVKVEADGLVNLYYLPNVTDKTPAIKIVGNRIYRTKKKSTDIDEYREFYIFTGSKIHVALIAIVMKMGMGK